MEFWAATEAHDPAYAAVRRCRADVEPWLNRMLAQSCLAGIPGKLRYVPIVMPKDMHARYPARSRLRKKERIYDCAPQLDYDVFVDGSFEEQLTEYVRGIALASPHLAGLGATADQISEFDAILTSAVERILVERPGQTRH